MQEEKIMGLTLSEIEEMSNELYEAQIDRNHPVDSNSPDSSDAFLKAFDEGCEKLHAGKDFFRAFRIKEAG
jgi:hypothetical protein